MTLRTFQIKLNDTSESGKEKLYEQLKKEMKIQATTFLSDGTMIITADNTISEIESKMNEKSLEVLESLNENIKHEFEDNQGIKQATEKLVQLKGKPKTTLEKKP